MSVSDDLTKKPHKARKVSLSQMMARGPKPTLGVMSYGRGKTIFKHPGVPAHLIKAHEARRKMTLTTTA